jgi:hypothetical protein
MSENGDVDFNYEEELKFFDESLNTTRKYMIECLEN